MQTHRNQEAIQAVSFKTLIITSPSFEEGQLIPVRHTCDGANTNPPLDIEHLPAETKSLAIIVKGTTVHKEEEWAHWLAWNIPPIRHIAENRKMEREGLNHFSGKHYCGPCPLDGIHIYTFKVYALDSSLNLPSNTIMPELETAISSHILGFGSLSGVYQRK